MEFCPNCGTRLRPTRRKNGKGTTFISTCLLCGYEKKETQPQEKVAKSSKSPPQECIAVIGKKEQRLRTLPTIKVECPKCENTTAYVWQVQTRGTDESSTQFFRCTRCNHTFREYS